MQLEARLSSEGLCFPSLLSKLKIALKWGHQPFHMHGLSFSYVCQHKCCITAE